MPDVVIYNVLLDRHRGAAHQLWVADLLGEPTGPLVVVERLPVVLVDHQHVVPGCPQARRSVQHARTRTEDGVEQRDFGHGPSVPGGW